MTETDAPTPSRGGTQVIPRPTSWRPGAPAPWHRVAEERLNPTVADVRAAVAAAPPPRRSPLEGTGVRASAVLAPVYPDADGGAVVVLTRRAQHLRSHRGEVCFPGGGQDPGEPLRLTALREAREEIDLSPDAVEVVGELDHLQTVTSRSFIVPFVGLLAHRPALRPNPHEVELVLDVPLAELFRPGVHREELWGLAPLERPLHFFEVEGDTIWGATAHMLRNLLALVAGVPH
jgi:8-oxo-dGTP pyrophosphatase MutT (NUDIX family)